MYTIQSILKSLRASPSDVDIVVPPYRGELLSSEGVVQRAGSVAARHRVLVSGKKRSQLRSRLHLNHQRILAAYKFFSEAAEHKEPLPAGAQWILDNYHIISQQFREIRRDLPRSYQKDLPRFVNEAGEDVPRVYDLVTFAITHTDSVVDPGLLASFVSAYQRSGAGNGNEELSIGEVWAIPIALRVALLENLRRLIDNVTRVHRIKQRVDKLVEEVFQEKAETRTSNTDISLALIQAVGSSEELTRVAAPLLRRLRARGSSAYLALQWVEERLREQRCDPHELQRNEEHAQAADLVSIGNVVTSLRTIDSSDWRAWFEEVSIVHQILTEDPAGVYHRSTFDTKDSCRRGIERIARRSARSEKEVARSVIECASRAPHGDIQRYVGHHLAGKGIAAFEATVQYQATFFERCSRTIASNGLGLYAGGVLTVGATFAGTLGVLASRGGVQPWWYALPISIMALPFAIESAIRLIQNGITRFVHPKPLPRLNFEDGIPAEARTAIVVHGLAFDNEAVADACGGLEIRYLGNQAEELSFGLLLDLPDAQSETTSQDSSVIHYAISLIDELNKKYGTELRSPFFLCMRKRVWSDSEQRYICEERKRGKLEAFNRWLLGEEVDAFIAIRGDRAWLRRVVYVITLDLDTQLPPGTAWKLIGTIAHPHNTPQFDPETGVVVSGYGIIQPRVDIDWRSARASTFAELFGGQSGLDPYSRLVSDVYQDAFGEGSFVGKGIYAVAPFEKALHDRIPSEQILSHDLFEGAFARVGYASDIELFDGFPARIHSHARRQHRWIRGDWQLLPWIWSRVPQKTWQPVRTPLSILNRIKLIDNLRRSLVELSLVGTLIAIWFIAPPTLAAIHGLIAFLLYFSVATTCWDQFRPRFGMQRRLIASLALREVSLELVRISIQFITAPYYAYTSLHAITQALYRTHISRRHLLEWESMGATEKRHGETLVSYIQSMKASTVAMGTLLLLLCTLPMGVISYALPPVLSWLSAPAVAWLLSLRGKSSQDKISKNEQALLRDTAKRTWNYFNHYLTPRYNYLIPDNLQVFPEERVAERTSPTNIGLSLLAIVSAYDLGFLSLSEAVAKLDAVLASLEKLERFQGHFLNWYEITQARALTPRYVSTVDSGNLVGHLMLLEEFAKRAPYTPLVSPTWTEASNFLSLSVPLSVKNLGELWRSVVVIKRELAQTKKLEGEALELQKSVTELSGLLSWLDFVPLLRDLGEQGLLPPKVRRIEKLLTSRVPSLSLVRKIVDRLIERFEGVAIEGEDFKEFLRRISDAQLQATAHLERIKMVRARSARFVAEADFRTLYDKKRNLFFIGYNLESGNHDRNYYDLLASEARLTSLVAIAHGTVPEKHWFMLGRSVAQSTAGNTLLSWSGTMFEYLMPYLVCYEPEGTLLGDSHRVVVQAQQRYTAYLGIPWGISESGYSGVDFERTYQYKAFGVPGLGLKRGLADDLVISPYSSLMAVEIAPRDVVQNLKKLQELNVFGTYGFYEAVDFTAARLSAEERYHIIRSFFAHHQGMSLVALNNFFNGGIMRERFHAHPRIQATDFLLHERFPLRVEKSDTPLTHSAPAALEEDAKGERSELFFEPYHTRTRAHVLSNGTYSVHVTTAGCGESFVKSSTALTRWGHDTLRNRLGTYFYLKEQGHDALWSATYEPVRAAYEHYEARFDPHKAEFITRVNGVASKYEVVISPEDNVEVRKITCTNLTAHPKTLEITSYGEVVLGARAGDRAHPAFSKLSVQSEYVEDLDALIFKRRPRAPGEKTLYMAHTVAMSAVWARLQFESSREQFIGRGHTLAAPQALSQEKLSGTQGTVIDPIFSLRTIIEIDPASSQEVYFLTMYAESREELVRLISKYREIRSLHRVFELSWNQSDVEIRHTQGSIKLIQAFNHLANAVLYPVEELKGPREAVEQNRLGQSGLWRFGISGDFPIVLVTLSDPEQAPLARDALFAHEYLRRKGVQFDLVLLNEFHGGYLQTFQEELDFLLRTGASSGSIDQRAGVFLRNALHLSVEEKRLLLAYARVSLSGTKGSFAEQLVLSVQPLKQSSHSPVVAPRSDMVSSNTRYKNGIGECSEDGRCYTMQISRQSLPPRPWSNVVANDVFGFLITESGGGFTWSGNSRENRLTPWSNDPVLDPVSEVIYLRDTVTGEFWSITPAPCGPEQSTVSHGFGSSRFIGSHRGIAHTATIFGGPTERAKWSHLVLKNSSDTPRTLGMFLYSEWVLANSREQTAYHIRSHYDGKNRVLCAENAINSDVPQQILFLGSSEEIVSYTTDRQEFLGVEGDVQRPAILATHGAGSGLTHLLRSGLSRPIQLSKTVGAGYDSAGIIKIEITLKPGEERQVLFTMGVVTDQRELQEKAKLYCSLDYAKKAAQAQEARWHSLTDTIQVTTPDAAFSTMVNGWLLYQTISGRMLGKTGFYQSSGAIGFRDQLQDSLALLYTAPERTRAQILLHASRQFKEGDVQHWWHPPLGRGVRTKIKDNYLWLPFATAHYVAVTGDVAILDEQVPFLEGPKPNEHQGDLYYQPSVSSDTATLYDHCVRALEHADLSPRGLPHIGHGDWNDGFNHIGHEGKGESIWLGWFLAKTLRDFAPLAEARGIAGDAARWRERADYVVRAVEEHGWDGAWYRRAYFDDGSPVGSAQNRECQIDAIAQSWSIISGLGAPERQAQSFESLLERLVDHEKELLLLLTPPFDTSDPSPGYIQGYVPGLRENGGQYTHAATWTVLAAALLKQGTRAHQLFSYINPLSKGVSRESVARYKNEPYVLSGDVYFGTTVGGLGGWSWYTGSSAWLYRVAIEYILGLQVRGDSFTIDPVIPAAWDKIAITAKLRGVTFDIVIKNPDKRESGVRKLTVNGALVTESKIPLTGWSQERVSINVVL
jgi:cyclic beta-1,2-glucan synthetase